MVAILEVVLGSATGSGSAAAQADQRAGPPVQGVVGVVVPGSAAEAGSVALASVPGSAAEVGSAASAGALPAA